MTHDPDRPCTTPGCTACRHLNQQFEGHKQVFASRPQPTDTEIHDTPHTLCPTCGGPTYQTDTGPWCPKAGCPGAADQAA